MGPNQLFQRLVLLEQNDYWIGGQTWHGDLLSPLRIRHATTQPIRLLKTLHPRWSQNFRSDVLGIGFADMHHLLLQPLERWITRARGVGQYTDGEFRQVDR